MDTKDIIKKLGCSQVSNFMYNSINSSIRKYYNFNGDVNWYNPNIDYFTHYHHSLSKLNNRYNLISLCKRKNRIKTIGYVYKAFIQDKKKNSKFYDDIFVKELPIISSNLYPIVKMRIPFSISPINSKYNTCVYDKSSAVNVEIFISYLVSKLKELNISPTFLKFYGCNQITFNKFTYSIGDEPDLQSLSSDNSCSVFYSDDDIYLEVYDMPAYLLSVEKADIDIDSFKLLPSLDNAIILSMIFQLFSAIITMYNLFGIKHNDLHLGNIMFSKTDKDFLYYKVDNTYYCIPTFGFEAKIIDWGRATYNFYGFKGKNSTFNVDGECFGQYRYNKLGSSRSSIELEYNKYSDIVMLSHNLLYDFNNIRNTKLGKFLKNIIIANDGTMLNYTKFDWSIYRQIGTKKFNIRPRNIIKNKIFSSYIMKPNDHISNGTVYKVTLDKNN